MEIVGYVAYASLVVLAIAWTIDVRNNLVVEMPAMLRAVYFVAGAALMPAFNINMLHALWVVPFGCFFARIIAPILIEIPVISRPFLVAGHIFARMVRIGVPRHKIEEAQSAAMRAAVQESKPGPQHNIR